MSNEDLKNVYIKWSGHTTSPIAGAVMTLVELINSLANENKEMLRKEKEDD